MSLNLIPPSNDEMNELQGTVVDKMIELNKTLCGGDCPDPKQTEQEIVALSRLSKKVANYQKSS